MTALAAHYTPDHEAFRDAFRRFMDKEIAPFHGWEEQGLWRARSGARPARKASVHDDARGIRRRRRRHALSVIQIEELGARGFTGIGFGLHSDIVAPYILHYGTEEQKKTYLPKLASGEMVGAIAMSEPGSRLRPAGRQDHRGRGRRQLTT